jgi:tRNA-dihydrouridine synthase B
MQIKTINLNNPVILAPMAGITDRPFRDLVKNFGCGLVYTEMISAKALTYKNVRTKAMVDIKEEKGPVSVQMFGSEPEVMAEAALILQEIGAEIIDINMGCPVPKVVKNCEGSALMRDLERASQIISSVVKKVTLPVTVKIRKGWDDSNINAVEFARMAEDNGVSAIAVHGRTRAQFYSGKADWDIIYQVKNAVKIPVIGNGDIWTPQDAKEMIEKTGCDGVMIGRGVLGNPWLIKHSVHFLEKGILLPLPTPKEKIEMAIYHMKAVVDLKGERVGIKEMRKHIAWYLKGMKDAARMREKVNKLNTEKEVTEMLQTYLRILEDETSI